MQAILQSAFLQALAYAVVASIWQMALLWLIVIAAFRLFKLSASNKFNIAFIAQITGFLFFICTVIFNYSSGAAKIIIDVEDENLASTINQFLSIAMPCLTVIYLGIITYKISSIFFSYDETLSLKKTGLQKASADNIFFVRQLSQLLSLRRKIEIYVSVKITCPLTTGFLKPVILIPLAAINNLTTVQMEAVILHELAHIKRFDYLLYIIQIFIQKIFFFNIFSLMLNDIIEREREIACDDWVLQFRYNSLHYAEALFKLGRLKTTPVLAMPLQGKKESLLLMRVRRLLYTDQKQPVYFQSLLFGMMSIAVAAFMLISFRANNIITEKQSAIETIKVDNKVQDNDPQITSISIIQKTLPLKHAQQMLSKQIIVATNKKQVEQTIATANKQTSKNNVPGQQYVYKVNQISDSLEAAMPQYEQAVNTQNLLSQELLQKAMSYQNFKRLEDMLTAAGNSITVTESDQSKNSYKKSIRIEATDKQGNKHIYDLIVELYQ